MTNPIIARYLIETPHPVEFAAEMIAGEQSSGTFIAVPVETEELKARARARVTNIKRLETVDAPSLPGSRPPKGQSGPVKYQRAEITIEFPFDNIGPNLPTLLATVCGNLYELAEHSGLKLLDLELPEDFARRYPGPQFGVAGTRRLAGVQDRPIIGTIVKPSVGLRPEATADLVRTLGEAGIDFVKDDELQAGAPLCRVHAPGQVAASFSKAGKPGGILFSPTSPKLKPNANSIPSLEANSRRCIGGSPHRATLARCGDPAATQDQRQPPLPGHDGRPAIFLSW